ncbi:kinase-like domain-containing protein [Aspergillus californicus]
MVLVRICSWVSRMFTWPFAPQSAEAKPAPQPLQANTPQPGSPLHAAHPPIDDSIEPAQHDPYLGLGFIGSGMTGFIFKLGEDRAVKKAKHYERNPRDPHTEYYNEINQETLNNEIQVYQRLGGHEGIIHCFQTSQYGIELALAQGDLADFLESHPEPDDTFKTRWMLSLIETFLYIHSRNIFVDDIAPRNILVLDNELRLADFGQSVLLPLDADLNSITENNMNVQIEILHVGWVLYAIASWHVHDYYFFDAEYPDFCWPSSFPDVDDMLCGMIIRKCWHGEYASMQSVQEDAYRLFAVHRETGSTSSE